mgnify:CR=1 FL=1|nr:MAG TPA: Major capsid protein [Caudoviricetes sp.]
MAINLATKFDKKVVERFSKQSITDAFCGKDYDFTGVKTVKVYTVDTVATADYTRSGTSRYGAVTELGDTVQELTVSQDKGFTFSIDKGNAQEQYNVKQSNKALQREWDEVVTPEIDKYRLSAWATGAGLTKTNAAAPTKDTVLEMLLTAGAAMNNALVPRVGRAIFIPESVYILTQLADQIITNDKLGEKAIVNGSVGMIGQMNVVPVPDSYMPEGVQFLIKYKSSTVDPVKLRDYKIHVDPPGISGDLVEGRYIYDSFVLRTKNKGIYVAKGEYTAAT